ncbi:MAG: YraN family protein, partial [Muribaculaceae bacterium]|nr:YraN family protein [Muribaculaceae bacterium]
MPLLPPRPQNFSLQSTPMNQIGKAGEDLACELLTGKGYAIIRRNAIVGGVEVDIIAQ